MTQKEADEIIALHKGWLRQPLALRSKADGRARLENISFSGLSFKAAELGNAWFYRCDFSKCDLRGVCLEGATMLYCNFDGSKLNAAKLYLS